MRYIQLALRYLLILVFFAAGLFKVFGASMDVELFTQIGLGIWFMYVVGVWELLASALTLTKKYRLYGLALMFLASVGAGIAQVVVIHGDWIHTLVLALISAFLVYRERHGMPPVAQTAV